MSTKIKVLVCDDSRTVRQMLVQFVNLTGDMLVVGEAEDGRQAVQLAKQLGPDVILMDVVMPQLDGLEATRQIMQICPTPIVMVSASLGGSETDVAFKAIKAGALTVLRKPSMSNGASDIQQLLSVLRAMASVHVIHHFHHSKASRRTIPRERESGIRPQVVAIVASTGGPAALSEIIWALPSHFDLPVVIVQHITADFVPSMVGWFNHVSKLPVQMACHGGRVLPGVIHVAPGNAHLCISDQYKFVVTPEPEAARYMPSGDILLDSVAHAYGERAIGIVLTGMGDDGARGLRAMCEAGASTIAQDEASSVVFGMPGEAIRLGAARQVLPLSEIAQALTKLVS